MSIKMSDDEQTAICNALRERLQSIAIMAVLAQDCISSDKCGDYIYDIDRDMEKANELHTKLMTADM